MYYEHEECEEEYEDDFSIDFFDPGSNSALRAGTRNQPCPTCGTENALTVADKRLGYQCDSCANAMEYGGGY